MPGPKIGVIRNWAVLAAALSICFSLAATAHAGSKTLRGHGGPVKSVVTSFDGVSALTGSFDYSMILWQLNGAAPEPARRISDHDGAVNSAKFVPGGDLAVAASDDGAVALWNLKTGELVHRFTGHTHKVVDVSVSSDGRWAVSAAWDRTARLWNLQTRKSGPVLDDHDNTVNAAIFSRDDKFVYTAGYDGKIRQWRVDDGSLVQVLYKHGWGINVLANAGNGLHLLFGSLDGTVGLIDPNNGELVKTLVRFERPVLSLAVSASNRIAAAGAGNGLVQVWDVVGWQVKYQYQYSGGPVWALAFAHDGKGVYFGGLDDHVAYWQMDPDKPFEVAQSDVPRRFQKSDDLGPGERQFARKCSICHSLGTDHANRAGPSLIGVFGRKAGSVPGYSYSKTLREAEFTWDEHTIDKLFAEGPEHFVPGSKMPLQKMSRQLERLALIEYLKRATQAAPADGETQSGG